MIKFLTFNFTEGKASFKDITETLNLPYRRTSDILNGSYILKHFIISFLIFF